MAHQVEVLEDKLANAKATAQATFKHIIDLVQAFRKEQEKDAISPDDALDQIQNHPLSVEVRSDWHNPVVPSIRNRPAEYRIVLSDGRTAVQLTGNLNKHCVPEFAHLECQDRFQPWTLVPWSILNEKLDPKLSPSEMDEILLDYARCFFFGENNDD